MTDNPEFYDAMRFAALGAQSGMIRLTPKPTNVTDLRTGRAWYPPGSLARALQDSADAFSPPSADDVIG